MFQLLRAMRARQQPDERDHVPHDEIHERLEQPSLDHDKSAHPNGDDIPTRRGRVCQPYGLTNRFGFAGVRYGPARLAGQPD